METAIDFSSVEPLYVDLAGETAMLLGRWIYFAEDQSPLAKINLTAHMGPKQEPGGGLSVEIKYAVQVFIRNGWKQVDGRDEPNWQIKILQEPGDWDSDMLASCAKLGRDPVREVCARSPEREAEIAQNAPELLHLFQLMELRKDIPGPELTSGKQRSKSL